DDRSRRRLDPPGRRNGRCGARHPDVQHPESPQPGLGREHELLHLSALRATGRYLWPRRRESPGRAYENPVPGRDPTRPAHSRGWRPRRAIDGARTGLATGGCLSRRGVALGGGLGTLSEIALALRDGRPAIGIQTWRFDRQGRTEPELPTAGNVNDALTWLFARMGGTA